ncbi:cytochrome c-type protein NapC [Yersinia enterocolitica]
MNETKKPSMIKRIWQWWRRPSRLALGTLLLIGFVSGIIFWGGFNTGMEMANTEKFCISCHEMKDNVYQEYMGTIHYNNRSGVKATCPDCHVPHEWGPKMLRKIKASKELYAKAFGLIDTPQKFEAHRLTMAENEWARMKANGSQECRNCHNFDNMDFTAQKTVAAKMHSKAIEEGKTCIDCHKGIAHKLPDMKDVPTGF